ncbi:ADP-ribosylglycohydrolase family protein [Bifidobacterium lemurum]|nr:ADP-ribosylglycohydrolase family protein [Bifidobacterium lemurum]
MGNEDSRNRALGALAGLALGDALGMPTQSMGASWIERAYGGITGLRDAIAEQPIAPNMPAGSVTDDTEQALLVARLIIEGEGHIDPNSLSKTLLDWEDDMRARGSLDLLGPSTKLALEQVRAGADISTTGRTGTTNGAAMRVTPVGVAHNAEGPHFTDYVYESCRVTHNTEHGFLSAYLVAAAVSFGIEGRTVREALAEAMDSAERVERRGAWSPKADVLARTRAAVDGCETGDEASFQQSLREVCGTSVEANESVAAAFAMAWRYADEPLRALLTAANIGGDTDTIAAMAGAMLGAGIGGAAFPQDLVGRVCEVSHLDLAPIADGLLEVRRTE